METVSGVSNWKLTIRREENHIVLLRGTTCDRRAVLPDNLFGLPVTVLGRHALSARPHLSRPFSAGRGLRPAELHQPENPPPP